MWFACVLPEEDGPVWICADSAGQHEIVQQTQLAGAQRARELYERLLCPLTPDYRAIVSAGGVPGSDVTLDDVKAVEVIWGRSVLKMKGNMTRKNDSV